MQNPTADGLYWVWERPKDVDRNVAVLRQWTEGGWHNAASDRVHVASDVAAWSGPINPPHPPMSAEEQQSEINASKGASVERRRHLRPPISRERVGEILALAEEEFPVPPERDPECTFFYARLYGASQERDARLRAVARELVEATQSLLAQCEGYADGYDIQSTLIAQLSGRQRVLPSGRKGPGIVLVNPEVYSTPKQDHPKITECPHYQCGYCGQTVGVGFNGIERLPRSPEQYATSGDAHCDTEPWRHCAGCGAELGKAPEPPRPVGCTVCAAPARSSIMHRGTAVPWCGFPSCVGEITAGIDKRVFGNRTSDFDDL